eukprot:TRINITY_DN1441_c1_g1_i2.p1 TRINITY_DN1441_c1_g1~~TRINITY_DN1441_c1_g1_i2.p1  ORF type:complete len:1279 (-),score=415.79 TRINITY_DN1441_c1_g1_i2:342-3845(-)
MEDSIGNGSMIEATPPPKGLSLFAEQLEQLSGTVTTSSNPESTTATIIPYTPSPVSSSSSSFFSSPLVTSTNAVSSIWGSNASLTTTSSYTTLASNGLNGSNTSNLVSGTSSVSEMFLNGPISPSKPGNTVHKTAVQVDKEAISAFTKDLESIKKAFGNNPRTSSSSSASESHPTTRTSVSGSSTSSISSANSSTKSMASKVPNNGILRGAAKPFYPGGATAKSTIPNVHTMRESGQHTAHGVRQNFITSVASSSRSMHGEVGRQSSVHVHSFGRPTLLEPAVQVLSTSANFPPPGHKIENKDELPIAVVANDLVGSELNRNVALQPLKPGQGGRSKGSKGTKGKGNNRKGKGNHNKGNNAQTHRLVSKYDRLVGMDDVAKVLSKDKDLLNSIVQALCRVERTQEALALVSQFEQNVQDHSYVSVLLALAEESNGQQALELLKDVLGGGRVNLKPQLFTALIHRCGDEGQFDVAVQVFELMLSQVNIQANEITFCSMVQAAMRSHEFDYAMGLVSEMRLHNFRLSGPLRMQLIGGLVDANRMEEAFEVYSSDEHRKQLKGHHYLLNSMLDYSSKRDDAERTLSLLRDMKRNSMYPANRTFTNVMHMFMRQQDVDTALSMLEELQDTGFHMTTLYFNTLLDSFSKINNEKHRRKGALMAKSVFEHMHVLGVEPDIITFGTLIKVYNRASLLKEAEHAFWMLKERRDLQPNIVIVNSMLDVQVRHGSLEEAQRIFDDMESEYLIRPQTITYNTLISGYGKMGKVDQALMLVDRMQSEHLSPDLVTHNIMIAAYAKIHDLENARHWFERMEESGYTPDLVSYSTMVNLCGKKGHLDEAFKLFQDMRNRNMSINNIAYGSLIEGCGMQGRIDDAIDLLSEMIDQRIQPSPVTFSYIISACGKAKKLDLALHAWKMMTEAGVPGNTVTYNTLIDACRRSNAVETALVLFQEMLETNDESTKPDVITFNTLINACQSTRDTQKALDLFGTMKSMDIPVTDITYNCLIDVASLNGDLECARNLLREMHDNGFDPTVITYTLMVRGCARAGNFAQAYRMLDEMKDLGIEANDITFSSLLDACTRRRDLDNAKRVVELMNDCGVEMTAITMVPLLHTYIVCDSLDEAHNLILDLDRRGFRLDKTAWDKMMETVEDFGEEGEQVRDDLEKLGCRIAK